MCHRRHDSVTQPEDGLNQPDRACSGLGVAQIALCRSEQALVAVGAVHLRQAAELKRIADRGTGAVRLDHSDGGRIHAGHGQGRPVDVGLSVQ